MGVIRNTGEVSDAARDLAKIVLKIVIKKSLNFKSFIDRVQASQSMILGVFLV